MNITVFSCSPKQDASITLQSMNYLNTIFPNDNFTFLFAGGMTAFTALQAAPVEQADLVIFSSSVMQFGLPAAMQSFLESMAAYYASQPTDKFFTLYTTSDKIMDNYAHHFFSRFMAKHSFKCLPSLSQNTSSLLTADGIKELVSWYNTTKELMVAPSDVFFTKQCKLLVLDISDGTSPELEATVNNLCSEYAIRGAIVSRLNMRSFLIYPCNACYNCYSSRKCILNKMDQWKELTAQIYSSEIVQVVGRLSCGTAGAMFKAWLDRHFQYGHVPLKKGIFWNYLLDTSGEDMSSLSDFTNFCRTINGFNGDITVGAADISEFSESIRSLILSYNNSLSPATDFASEAIELKYINLAPERQNLAPKDFSYFSRQGKYMLTPPSPALKPIYSQEHANEVMLNRLYPYRMTVYQAAQMQMMGQPGMMGIQGQGAMMSNLTTEEPSPEPMSEGENLEQ